MPTEEFDVTTFSVRENKPGHPFGSPAVLPLRNGTTTDCRIIVDVPVDAVPLDATIQSVILRFVSHQAAAGSIPARVYPNTKSWKSRVTWNSKPTIGTLINVQTKSNPSATQIWEWDITTWFATRSRLGLTLDVNTSTVLRLRGSSAASGKPVVVATYTVPPEVPGTLRPAGGEVSKAQPVLTYAGDEDMTEQWIEYSTNGTIAGRVYQSGWLPSSRGHYDPTLDPGTGTGKTGTIPVLSAGGEIYWRVQTNGPDGPSGFSGWVRYGYEPVTDPAITNPPATTDDGTPPLTWTTASQNSWQAFLYDENGLVDSSGWHDEPATRSWTPGRGVRVPGGHGRYVLQTTDGVTPRVSAEDAPTHGQDVVEFETVLSGSATAISTLVLSFEDPIPVLSGTRSLGTPDEVALLRDDRIVPIWDEDGDAHLWAPGADFFDGTDFVIRDYTADLRHSHSWSVLTRAGGLTSAVGPVRTDTFHTGSVWLVNPRTGEQVEVFGYNGLPVVEQSTQENSVLHTPVHGNLIVEPVRRRLVRTTRSGSVAGVVVDEAEDILTKWVEGDSGLKYRLIFGKVNWSVILGDHSPSDVFYSDECGEDRVQIALNWWERLRDY